MPGDTFGLDTADDIPEPPVEDTSEVDAEVGVDTQADFEMETELQVQDAVESLQQVEGLDLQAWQSLDAAGRLEVLQNIENHMAEIQGRPALEITAAEMDQNTFGGYNGQGIELNAGHIVSDMPVQEFVDTIVHEGRHAYQDYAVRTPGFVTDTALVNSWAGNMAPGNYLSAEEYGQELYVAQPIEADAWSYAGRITDALYGSQAEK